MDRIFIQGRFRNGARQSQPEHASTSASCSGGPHAQDAAPPAGDPSPGVTSDPTCVDPALAGAAPTCSSSSATVTSSETVAFQSPARGETGVTSTSASA
jgi:hypothetical protein